MSPAQTLLLLAGVQVAAVVSPGPNTMLVVQNAVRDRRLGLATAAGCWPASALWAVIGLAGVSTVVAAIPWFTPVLHVVCGTYLVFLGIKALLRSFAPRVAASTEGTTSWSGAFAAGFFTNATNPKSIAYYMSVFTATGALTLPLWGQGVAILVLPSMGTLYYVSLSLLMSSRPAQRLFGAAARWLDRVAGGAMLFFGAKLLATR